MEKAQKIRCDEHVRKVPSKPQFNKGKQATHTVEHSRKRQHDQEKAHPEKYTYRKETQNQRVEGTHQKSAMEKEQKIRNGTCKQSESDEHVRKVTAKPQVNIGKQATHTVEHARKRRHDQEKAHPEKYTHRKETQNQRVEGTHQKSAIGKEQKRRIDEDVRKVPSKPQKNIGKLAIHTVEHARKRQHDQEKAHPEKRKQRKVTHNQRVEGTHQKSAMGGKQAMRSGTSKLSESAKTVRKVPPKPQKDVGKYATHFVEHTRKRQHGQEKTHSEKHKQRKVTQKQRVEGKHLKSDIMGPPFTRSDFRTVPSKNPTFIMFNVQTTGLPDDTVAKMPHILQIGAKTFKSESEFNTYVIPKIPIEKEAGRLNRIKMIGPKTMLVRGQRVKAITIKKVLRKFFKWLQKYSNVILVAHNGRNFDFPIFMSACLNTGDEKRLFSSVCGLVDSLDVFRHAFPDCCSFKRKDLARDILSTTSGTYNSIEHVQTLDKLMAATKLTLSDKQNFSFPVNVIKKYVIRNFGVAL